MELHQGEVSIEFELGAEVVSETVNTLRHVYTYSRIPSSWYM